MVKPLPKRLNKEPLIDAIFEVRFAEAVPNILPGLLYTKLQGEKTLEQLPLSKFSQTLRDKSPNMLYEPLCRLIFERFYINIGDRSISISCRYPYPGWVEFKKEINKVIKALNESDLKIRIERHSLKYIDILPKSEFPRPASALELELKLANYSLASENHGFDIRLDVNDKKTGFIHLIRLASAVKATLTDNKGCKEGVAIDVDSIAMQSNVELDKFYKTLFESLDLLHIENKRVFFSCLTRETINSLEPENE